MSTSDIDLEKARLEQEKARILRQVAFASGLFQGDLTIRTLLDSLAEGVVIIDSSGTILLVNPVAEKLFGYQKEELVGRPHAMLIPERFRKIHEEHESHYFAEPKIRAMGELLDLVGLHRDGSEFPLEISLGFIETINGVLVLALINDIAIRKMLEARLQEKENQFRIQVERVKDFAIFTLDLKGNVLSWNAGAERMKGYRVEEIIGKHFSCFYTEEDIHAGKPEEELKIAAAEGQITDEEWRVHKDGSMFWAEVIITALHDEKGNLRAFSIVTRDITERKQAEDALRVSEAYYRTLFADNPSMLFTLNAELTTLSVSPLGASFLGYTPDELQHQSVLILIHNDDRPSVVGQLKWCLKNPNQVHRLQFRTVRKDGSLVWVEEIAQGVYDIHGTLNILVVCQDVSVLKRAEEEVKKLNAELLTRAAELEFANKELETFNYTVAHDLRQPLNLLSMVCQKIKMQFSEETSKESMSDVQTIHEITLRMDKLIGALLNFSRIGYVEPLRTKVDLTRMAHEVATELAQSEPERQTEFRITDGLTSYVDESLLRVVLENLLGNAWKYTKVQEKVIIEFGLTDIDGMLTYFVRDNGSGFVKEDADRLFIPFQRLPGTEKTIGFGIGLATVERIIRRHGGRVWAESELGKGATVYFTLSASGVLT